MPRAALPYTHNGVGVIGCNPINRRGYRGVDFVDINLERSWLHAPVKGELQFLCCRRPDAELGALGEREPVACGVGIAVEESATAQLQNDAQVVWQGATDEAQRRVAKLRRGRRFDSGKSCVRVITTSIDRKTLLAPGPLTRSYRVNQT